MGKHRIQGISDEFVPDILKMSEVNDVISVDDTDSIIMSQMLARVLGMGALEFLPEQTLSVASWHRKSWEQRALSLLYLPMTIKNISLPIIRRSRR